MVSLLIVAHYLSYNIVEIIIFIKPSVFDPNSTILTPWCNNKLLVLMV